MKDLNVSGFWDSRIRLAKRYFPIDEDVGIPDQNGKRKEIFFDH